MTASCWLIRTVVSASIRPAAVKICITATCTLVAEAWDHVRPACFTCVTHHIHGQQGIAACQCCDVNLRIVDAVDSDVCGLASHWQPLALYRA